MRIQLAAIPAHFSTTQILRWFLFSSASGLPRLPAALVSITLSLVSIFANPDLVRPYPRFAPDGHLRASFHLAINARYCNRSGYLSPTLDVTSRLLDTPSSLHEPVPELIARSEGSLDAYCATVTEPFTNNENTHQWIMRAYLRLRPNASVRELGSAFATLRAAAIVVIVYVLLRAGASLLLVVGVNFAAYEVLRHLIPYQYAMYPFISVVPLVLIALAVERLRHASPLGVWDFLVAGLITAVCVNLRTSHSPVYLALVLTFVIATLWRHGVPSPRLTFAGTAVGAFALGYLLFQVTFISSQERRGTALSANHLIAHPLVLGLALPESDLSRREGIRWNDSVGVTLATRIDPRVTYMSEDYEHALFQYYLHLWRAYPGEMWNLYVRKFQIAGVMPFEMASKKLDTVHLHRLGMTWIANSISGTFVILLGALLAVLGLWAYIAHGSLLAFAGAQLCVVVALLTIESAMIMPVFYVFYDGPLLFGAFLVPVVTIQLALDGARHALATARRLQANATL